MCKKAILDQRLSRFQAWIKKGTSKIKKETIFSLNDQKNKKKLKKLLRETM